jgi:phage shock protein C
MFFGVCRGLADHLDISAFWIRAIAVVTVLCSGFFPGVVAYLFAALIMKKEPYGYWYR